VFQILRDPKFDFMKYGRMWLSISAVIVVLSVGILVVRGLNLGIEFVGGTELELRFVETTDVQTVRDQLKGAGVDNPLVTTIGDEADHEIYIRIGNEEGSAEDQARLTRLVTATLRGIDPATKPEDEPLDLNISDAGTIATALEGAGVAGSLEAKNIGGAITQLRKESKSFANFDEIREIPLMTSGAMSFLESNAQLGPLAVRKQSYVFPAVGAELLSKAQVAIFLSLIMMMLYIWLRFQLQWGFAAVLALAHDTGITLGLFSLFNMELSLPVVAAFLTLVGYSVNDTVVVFDRIRENVRGRAGSTLSETINRSINQTLGRTIITSGLTWVVVFGLYVYGGSALRAFSFVLTVGVVVGTYSSIFIASPLLVLGERFFPSKASKSRGGSAAAEGVRRAKKVRT